MGTLLPTPVLLIAGLVLLVRAKDLRSGWRVSLMVSLLAGIAFMVFQVTALASTMTAWTLN
ncbi:hypothetical protein AB0B45_37790 [Nonomuraea sp. NPDC049152]|uniref:hypothetical protein n=1 Tax=Nonomuraea sp. NPDC049152 TaxID=3154350 RepID=UPI0033CCC456